MKATDRRARLPKPERCCKSYARSIQMSAAMRLARSHFRGKAGIVIGSVARGDNVPTSDLDLLILTTSKARLTSYYSMPSVVKTTPPINIITYTPRDFKKFWDEGSLFVYHVLTEGMVAWDDGTLARLLRRPFKLKRDFSADIAIQIERLKMFRDPRAFDGIFIYAFAELFKIYKNIVFFTLAEVGHPEFNKKKGVTRFYRLRPNLVHLRPLLASLEPYYMASVRGAAPVPTSSPKAAAEKLTRVVRALEELGEAVR